MTVIQGGVSLQICENFARICEISQHDRQCDFQSRDAIARMQGPLHGWIQRASSAGMLHDIYSLQFAMSSWGLTYNFTSVLTSKSLARHM